MRSAVAISSRSLSQFRSTGDSRIEQALFDSFLLLSRAIMARAAVRAVNRNIYKLIGLRFAFSICIMDLSSETRLLKCRPDCSDSKVLDIFRLS